MTLHLLPTLADSIPDISSVPAEFVRSFFIMLAFVLGLIATGWVCYRKGARVSGHKDEPLHVAQPVEIKKHPEYAPREETRREIHALDQKIEKFRDEWLDKLNESQRKASDEIKDLMEAGHKREMSIITAMGGVRDDLTKTVAAECRELRKKADADAAHMHKRIDDFIRLAGGKK